MLAFDIETVPLAASLDAPFPRDEFEPPSNYKNPDAIAGWFAKKEAEWRAARVKQCSLNPRLGRIVAIGYAAVGTMSDASLAMTEADERDLLVDFWARVTPHIDDALTTEPHIITWNGGFDVRFILLRSLAHGLALAVGQREAAKGWSRRYDLRSHFDCKAALMNHDNRVVGEGLDEWCAFFGLPTKPMQADAVYAAVQAGEWEKVRHYAMHDATMTRAIFERIRPYFGEGV